MAVFRTEASRRSNDMLNKHRTEWADSRYNGLWVVAVTPALLSPADLLLKWAVD